MKTINKMKQQLKLSDDILSNIANLPTTDRINEAIIVLLTMAIQSDIDALQFCDYMETLTENKTSSYIEILRNGKLAR